MSTLIYFLIAFVLIAAVVAYRLRAVNRQTRNFIGPLLVACPENLQTAAVKVATGHAMAAAAVGKHDVHLKTCSRWPEKAGCAQDCLKDIEADPATHRVWNIVAEWFQDKKCIYCGKAIAPLSHLNPPPALLTMDDEKKKTAEWDSLPPESLPDIMQSALPVCWNCHQMETFRKAYPDLVTDRPWQN
jgi:hypothetical protein